MFEIRPGVLRGAATAAVTFAIAATVLAFAGIGAVGPEAKDGLRAFGYIASVLAGFGAGTAGVWQAIAGDVGSRLDAMGASVSGVVAMQLLFLPGANEFTTALISAGCALAGAAAGAALVARRITYVTVPD
jgi:hypothetical protein